MRIARLSSTFWAACLLGLACVAVFAPQIARFDPLYAEPLRQFAPPTGEHWLGLDQLGRDVASRLIWGTRHSLWSAIQSAAIAIVLGMAAGGASGAIGGWVERFLMRFVDVLLSLPGLLLALVFVAVLGEGTWQVAGAVGLALAPTYARLVRAAVLSVREELYIEAVYALGASHWRVLWRHLLPNALRQITAMGTVIFAWALMNGAALDFLGVAGSLSDPSWGRMINEGRLYLSAAPRVAIAPGVMLTLSVVSVMGLSDSWRAR